MRRRIVILGGITLIAAALGAGGYFGYYRYVPVVKVSSAAVRPVSEMVYGSGTVEPVQWAKVVPLQRRRVVKLCRCEGLAVKKDDVLAQQDDAEERSMLNELEIRHQQLQRDLDRADKDRQKGVITKAEYEQRETAFNESRSRISAQKTRIETLVLRAPMDGMVLRRDGEVGEIAGPTDVLFWVGNPSPLQVVADINEEEITKIAVGQTAFMANEAFVGESLRAKVSQITPKGDPTKKTFRVYLMLPSDTPLRIGMTVEINIVFREKPSAILVPLEAVVGNAVQVVTDGRINRTPVTTGIRGSRAVEIVGGVAPGALVVTPARADLKDGRRVRAESQTQVAPEFVAKIGSESAEKPRTSQGGTELTSLDLAISSALSAHIDSIVGDARKAYAKRK